VPPKHFPGHIHDWRPLRPRLVPPVGAVPLTSASKVLLEGDHANYCCSLAAGDGGRRDGCCNRQRLSDHTDDLLLRTTSPMPLNPADHACKLA
jgi:hypothetical protein